MPQPILVFSTHNEKNAAQELARKIVESQLAACVQVLDGATSIYTWNGKLEESSEVLMIIKSFAEHFEALKNFIKENHPYEVPEIVAVKIKNLSNDYLKWMSEVLK